MKKIPVLVILFFLMVAMAGCNKDKTDLIVRNANVYTVDGDFSLVQSFAVSEGKVVATGTDEEIQSAYSSDIILNAEGKFIYPGFNDAHAHFNGYGNNLMQYADLRGTESPDEIYKVLQEHHKKFGGEWVLGRSWDQNDW
ncbi:MAG TPA: amidohydrolase family protein, partial [Tangfeifania sp.]|nr:amidohydrolase family protein [Tangfeifania sp.]